MNKYTPESATQTADYIPETTSLDWAAEASVSEDGVIRNVALSGNTSKNGYAIPATAFGDSDKVGRLYNGKLVFINHQPADKRSYPTDRRAEDLAGYISNARLVDGRPRGDVSTEGTPRGEMLRNLAKAKIPNVGMSHVALYDFNSDRTSVESVEDIATVDTVVFPATTQTFFENTQGNQDKGDDMSADASTKLVEKFQEDNKALTQENTDLKARIDSFSAENESLKQEIETLKAESAEHSTTHKSEMDEMRDKLAKFESDFQSLESERDELLAKNDAYEAETALAERRESIAAMLKKHEINTEDKVICSERFMKSLISCEDENEREALIEDRAKLIGESANGSFGSRNRQSDNSDNKKFDIESELDTESWLTRA